MGVRFYVRYFTPGRAECPGCRRPLPLGEPEPRRGERLHLVRGRCGNLRCGKSYVVVTDGHPAEGTVLGTSLVPVRGVPTKRGRLHVALSRFPDLPAAEVARLLGPPRRGRAPPEETAV